MLNYMVRAEFSKLKKNKMVCIGFFAAIVVPIFFIVKSLFIDTSPILYQEWVYTVSLVLNIVLPVMSGLFIIQLIQKEYEERTIINILTAPTDRSKFVISKVTVWFSWYLFTLSVAVVISLIGAYCLYREAFHMDKVISALRLFTQTGLLSFIACLPIIWLTVKNRTLFSPPILFTLLFTVLQTAGSQISEKWLPVASFIPWTAVTISQMISAENPIFYICMISILLFGLLGVLLAIKELMAQDL